MKSNSVLDDLRGSLRQPEFWAYSSWLDIVIRYRRTQIGVSWLFLTFAFFVVVMGLKFGYLMGKDPAEFLPYVAVGYMTWRFMVTILNDSATTFRTHRSYIMDGKVRFTDYLLRSVAKAGFNLFFAVVIVAIVLAWSPHAGIAGLLTMLVTFPLVVLNMVWLGLCLSFFGARYPDTHELIGTVLMAGFLLTPIIWDVSSYPPDTLRGSITRLNPAFHLIEVVRAPILGRLPETNSIIIVVLMALAGWLLAAWMYRRYARFVPLWL